MHALPRGNQRRALWVRGVRSSLWCPRGVWAASVPRGRGGQCWALSCPAAWCTVVCAAPQQSRPAAGFDRLSSVLKMMPRAQPPACFWEPWAEFRALRRGQGEPACSCLTTLFLGPSPRYSVLVFVVRCPEFPFRTIPGSAAGPGSPGSRSEMLALLGLGLHRYRGVTDQSLRLPSVYLGVFHGT